MVSKLALLSNLLLASVALADQLRTIQPGDVASRTMNNTYAGAVSLLPLPASEKDFIVITGTIIVPVLDNGYQATVSFSCMVDGINCNNNATLQVGLTMIMQNGSAGYTPWCRWMPTDLGCNFTGLHIQAGDSVTFTVNVSSPTTAMISIVVQGDQHFGSVQTYDEELTVPPFDALCQENVAWIMQPYLSSYKSLEVLAGFGNLTVTNAIAYGPYIGHLTPADGFLVNMVLNWNQFTNVSAAGSDLTIQYLPPSLGLALNG